MEDGRTMRISVSLIPINAKRVGRAGLVRIKFNVFRRATGGHKTVAAVRMSIFSLSRRKISFTYVHRLIGSHIRHQARLRSLRLWNHSDQRGKVISGDAIIGAVPACSVEAPIFGHQPLQNVAQKAVIISTMSHFAQGKECL
jgi:hypothetical protein